jgi:hypothetical protein
MMADRPYLRVFDLNNCFNDGFDVTGGSEAIVVADQMNGDGMIIDDIQLISRGAAYDVNLYLHNSNQTIRTTASRGQFINSLKCSGTKTVATSFTLPKLLTPVPRVGTEPYSRGLYLPRGFALWAAINTNAANTVDGPNLLIQGGVY